MHRSPAKFEKLLYNSLFWLQEADGAACSTWSRGRSSTWHCWSSWTWLVAQPSLPGPLASTSSQSCPGAASTEWRAYSSAWPTPRTTSWFPLPRNRYLHAHHLREGGGGVKGGREAGRRRCCPALLSMPQAALWSNSARNRCLHAHHLRRVERREEEGKGGCPAPLPTPRITSWLPSSPRNRCLHAHHLRGRVREARRAPGGGGGGQQDHVQHPGLPHGLPFKGQVSPGPPSQEGRKRGGGRGVPDCPAPLPTPRITSWFPSSQRNRCLHAHHLRRRMREALGAPGGGGGGAQHHVQHPGLPHGLPLSAAYTSMLTI